MTEKTEVLAPDEVKEIAQPMTPMRLLELATQRGADIDVLERLLTLQERWEENERKKEAAAARKAYIQALTAFKLEPPTIVKTKQAGFDSKKSESRTEYKYATLAQVIDVIAPALSKHKLSHRWDVRQIDGKIQVTCTLTHEQGHSESVFLEAGADTTGSKNAIQAIGSTISYLERYTLLSITGLAAADQDTDAQTSIEPISADQKDQLIQLIKDTKSETKKFLEWAGVGSIDELPAYRFSEAVALLEAKRRRAGAA